MAMFLGSLEAEFSHSCPQPALGWASDELSAFDLCAWLSITGHGAFNFPALVLVHKGCCFHHGGDEPGRGSAPTQSPSCCQAAVITPTSHPSPSLPSLLSGGWPAPWKGERGNWEARGAGESTTTSLTLHLMEITLLWHRKTGRSPGSAAQSHVVLNKRYFSPRPSGPIPHQNTYGGLSHLCKGEMFLLTLLTRGVVIKAT